MRRTQARQVELVADVPLAATPCRKCRHLGVTIVAMGSNDSGAIELGWCGPDCARLDGWPWLVEERVAVSDARRASLSGLRL